VTITNPKHLNFGINEVQEKMVGNFIVKNVLKKQHLKITIKIKKSGMKLLEKINNYNEIELMNLKILVVV
jgi:hypothetical protein